MIRKDRGSKIRGWSPVFVVIACTGFLEAVRIVQSFGRGLTLEDFRCCAASRKRSGSFCCSSRMISSDICLSPMRFEDLLVVAG